MSKQRKKAELSPSPEFERFELRMSPREKKTFQSAADRFGVSLAQWLRLAAWQAINDHNGAVKLVEIEATKS